MPIPLAISQTEEFCLKIRKGNGEYTKLTYTKSKGEVEVNTYFSGRLIHEHHHMPFNQQSGKLALRILCDTTILDVFVQNGESYKGMMFFPSEQSNGFSMDVKVLLQTVKSVLKRENIYVSQESKEPVETK